MSALDAPTAPSGRPAPPTPPSGGPRPRTVYVVGGLAFVVLIVLAAVAAVAWPAIHGDADRTAHSATGAVNGRDEATLDLLSGVSSIDVRAADLGDTLYRVESPQTPSVTDADGHIQVHVTGGDATLTVELNRDVRWTVRFTAGSQSNTADLRGLTRLTSIEYVGGVSAIELTLPEPREAAVPVRVDGGASAVRVHAPGAVPVRVWAGGGAGGVTVDGVVHNGVAAGEVFTSEGYDTAAHRYDLHAAGGVATISVDRAVT